MALQIFILRNTVIDPIQAQAGTNTNQIVIANHGMQTGEMILNATRNTLGAPASRTVTVIDVNTLSLNRFIDGQTAGDYTYLFKYIDITTYLKANSFRLTTTIQKSNTCNFKLVMDKTDIMPLAGQQIKVAYNDKVLFGGSIYDVKTSALGVENKGHKLLISISSNGYNHIPARRSITVDYSVPKTSGEIVTDMVNNYLSSEGITAGTINSGADWDAYPSDFPDKCISVKQVLDDMANKSGYKWYIDIERKLHFLENDTIVNAPHELKDY